jgi:23S rRNA pseudouridine1911/1915/1917 synthase
LTPHPRLIVLHEDNHCLVVEKPAGLLTMGDHSGEITLVDHVRNYLRSKYNKPGNVFVGVVHRLDRPVSGVVAFAKTSKGASRLSEQFRIHQTEKVYLALVEGNVDRPSGLLHDYIVKDHQKNLVSVTRDRSQGQECILEFQRLQRFGAFTLLEIRPRTGRSHQIRVQLSSRGWSIVGDKKYGSRTHIEGMIALHASSLTFAHPTTKETIEITSELPKWGSRI